LGRAPPSGSLRSTELTPAERDERIVRWIPLVVPLFAALLLALVLLIEAEVL
jgi:hypothetical protein